jgi:hypothetical protein
MSIRIPERELSVLAESDVVVCGGGPAGIAAALAARRAGRSVTLLEQTGMLGGMGTAGLVPSILVMDDGERVLADGICREVVDEMARRMGVTPDYHWQNTNPEILKRLYDELVTAAGIEVFLGLPAVDAQVEDGRVTVVVVSTRRGLKAVSGRVFVDATGDGNLAAWAGAAFDMGDEQGRTMSPTLCVQYAGVDWARYREIKPWPHGYVCHRWNELVKAGKIPIAERHLCGVWPHGPGTGSGNLGHIYGVNGLDEKDITRGYVEGRRLAPLIHQFYRDHVPGFAGSELVATASLLSVRETRRIRGDYQLTFDDYRRRADFDDEIGRYAGAVDIHSSSTDPKEQEATERRIEETKLKKGESYGIPYRALVPRELINVLVAGRCVSCDRAVQASLRIQAACFITGQAAGGAAALAAGCGGAVRDVQPRDLQRLLRRQGAYLRDELGSA